MARIPFRAAQRSLDTGNVVQYPSGSPVGQALQNAGGALEQVASRFQQQQEVHDNFKLRIAQQQLDLELDGDLDKATQDMPADAAGLHDGFVGQIDPDTNEPVKPGLMDEKVNKVRESLPQSVRPKFDAFVPLVRQEYSNKAAKKEYTARQAFYRVEVQKMLGNLEKTVAQIDPNDTKAFEAFRAQGEADINATGLDKLEKEVLRTKWRGDSAEAVWKALAARDPEAAKKALGISVEKPVARTDIRGGGGNEETVFRFFLGKGYTPQQAAGIVGNLIQESGLKSSGAVGDGGTAHGIAQWRGERLTALKAFARSKGKAASDLQTQLEFIDHELNSSEGGTGAKLKAAKTAKEAAEAFISYERPQGWTPDNPRGGHGWRSRANNAVHVLGRHGGKEPLTEDFATEPGQDRADPRFQDIPLERRIVLTNYAEATIQKAQTEFEQMTLANKTARKEELDLGIETGVVVRPEEILNDQTVDDGDKALLLRRLEEKQESNFSATNVIETLKSGGYLDSSDSKVKKGLNQIFKDSGGGQALVKGEQQTLATTMFAWQKSNVIADDAKQTLQDMMRSPDDQVMIRGLSYLDELQRRNPAAFDANFPEGTAKAVQRYNDLNGFTAPNKIAEEMRKRTDPAWIKAREPLQKIGQAEADKNYDTAKVVALFDDRFALNYFSSAPEAPKVAGDGAMLANDFRRLYADAYAETGDSDKAEANAFALLQKVWSPSFLNGGAITRHAPEKYYPTKDMSHEWMKTQLEADLKALGYVQEGNALAGIGGVLQTETVRPYSLRAIPLTEAQIYARQLPQYAVVVENPETGEPDMVTDKDGKLMLWPAKGDVPQMLKDSEAEFQKKQAGQRSMDDETEKILRDAEEEELEKNRLLNTPLQGGAYGIQ